MIRKDIMSLFSAAVGDDSGSVDRILAKIGEDDWPAVAGRIGVVFGIAVERKFGLNPDFRAIADFVTEARAELAEGDDLPPLESEGMIRAALGEPELASRIPPEVRLTVQFVLAVKILHDEQLSERELEQILAEADALADRWGG